MNSPDVDEIKTKIEALLYCLPDGLSISKISESIKIKDASVVESALKALQEDYASRSSGIKVVTDNALWKFAVPDEHSELIKDAAEPEFDRGTIETLAYIAWRGGSRQCDVVRVRSNKAYRHIKILLNDGFIESEKTGLTKFLSLTKKFYRYFNVASGQKIEFKVPENADQTGEAAQQNTAVKAEPEQQTPETKTESVEQNNTSEPNNISKQENITKPNPEDDAVN